MAWKCIEFCTNGPPDNMPRLFLVMAWHCLGNKPLSETMLNQLTNTYMLLLALTQCHKINGLVQERHNSSASAMELCLSCTKPSKWCSAWPQQCHPFTPHWVPSANNITSCHLKSLITPLFVQQYSPINTKENTKAPHYWSFMKGIHRWSMDSPHKI